MLDNRTVLICSFVSKDAHDLCQEIYSDDAVVRCYSGKGLSMKTFDVVAKEILDSLHITNPVLLGEGSEAQVYSYMADKVVKIFKTPVEVEYLRKLGSIYEFLSSHTLPFALPGEYEIQQRENTVFLIEKRLVGKPIMPIYATLDEQQRQHLLHSFLKAVDAFKTISLDVRDYGRLMHDPNDLAQYTDWPQFIKDKAPFKLQETRATLREDGVDVDHVLSRFMHDVDTLPRSPKKNFVHGDYFFGNVLINDKLEISAVLDVSWWSAVGDHMMDIAGATMFLGLYDFVSPQDHAYLTEQAVRMYGEDVLTSIRIYEVYYSLLLSDCKTSDTPAYRWSLKNLRRYMLS